MITDLERKPQVLVTASDIYKDGKKNPNIQRTYIEQLQNVGLHPVVVTPSTGIVKILEKYEKCSGVLITGGTDIHPSRYGQLKDPMTVAGDPERDEIEIGLFIQAIRDNKPTLGICRGTQVMTVALGGQLYQHLPNITNERHFKPNMTYQDLSVKDANEVTLTGEGITIFASRIAKFPTGHHQAIDNEHTGGLEVIGRSNEGIIEMVRFPDMRFGIGTQGHPEILKTPLFPNFATAVGIFDKHKIRLNKSRYISDDGIKRKYAKRF